MTPKFSIYSEAEKLNPKSITHCLNCGVSLLTLQNKEASRGRRLYCSRDCLLKKPPQFALAERIYGKPIRVIIVELLNSCKSVETVAQRIGVNREALYRQMKKERIKKVMRYE